MIGTAGAVNGEATGGTRYNVGKAKLVGVPMKGLRSVRRLAGCGDLWRTTTVEAAVGIVWADFEERLALGDLSGLGADALLLLAALHRIEDGGGTDIRIDAPWPALGLYEVGRVSEYGAEKYALFDWHLGQSLGTLLNCTGRHLARAIVDPFSKDHESGLLHLGHATWNVLTVLHFEAEGRMRAIDDVRPWLGVPAADRDLVTEIIRAQRG